MGKNKIEIYDTTLRDGAQAEGISFSSTDKMRIARRLDEMGFDYIEGGNPGSNPKDIEFFKQAKKVRWRCAKITAFGSTRRPKIKPAQDKNLNTALRSGVPVITIFGKSSPLHVRDVLKTNLEENLEMIASSVEYLKKKGREVIYDAEHFFDGYKEDPDYALKTLEAAQSSGASVLVLCETNGGTLPHEVADIISDVRERFDLPLGIHTHNDSGVALANTIVAVRMGIVHVQGTINGYGERCGNADLCTIIPTLSLKMGYETLGKKVSRIQELSLFVSELANVVPDNRQPYVGSSAFAHKGGMHVDAVRKNPKTFEHVEPHYVGNRRRILISELSGGGSVASKAREFNIDIEKNSSEMQKVLRNLKKLEHEGYQFEAADASFKLFIRRIKGERRKFFRLEGFHVSVEKWQQNRDTSQLISEATIKLSVKGKREHTASEGDGPINAMDNALRKALVKFYPTLAEMHLSDFRVRVLDAKEGTAAKVRVLITSRDAKDTWNTIGVSENIIEASWQALVDSIEYKLLKDGVK
ncbi:MAG: citramalate synthase [Candidatus Omnitrophica bacterium]|nr:citramalate synthase [Candidatus Omnitrophota bacterium]